MKAHVRFDILLFSFHTFLFSLLPPPLQYTMARSTCTALLVQSKTDGRFCSSRYESVTDQQPALPSLLPSASAFFLYFFTCADIAIYSVDPPPPDPPTSSDIFLQHRTLRSRSIKHPPCSSRENPPANYSWRVMDGISAA